MTTCSPRTARQWQRHENASDANNLIDHSSEASNLSRPARKCLLAKILPINSNPSHHSSNQFLFALIFILSNLYLLSHRWESPSKQPRWFTFCLQVTTFGNIQYRTRLTHLSTFDQGDVNKSSLFPTKKTRSKGVIAALRLDDFSIIDAFESWKDAEMVHGLPLEFGCGNCLVVDQQLGQEPRQQARW